MAVDKLLACYITPDGAPVGLPPALSDASPAAQALVQLAVALQSEAYSYAR